MRYAFLAFLSLLLVVHNAQAIALPGFAFQAARFAFQFAARNAIPFFIFLFMPNRPLAAGEVIEPKQQLVRFGRQLLRDTIITGAREMHNATTSQSGTGPAITHLPSNSNNQPANNQTLPAQWQQIRQNQADITQISRHTNWPQERLQIIKQRVFFATNAQPNAEIIGCWSRLISGTHTHEDLGWLSEVFFSVDAN